MARRSPEVAPQLPAELPDGRVRAVVDAVLPAVDGGRFAAKCVAGEPFEVEAHCFTDGHDQLRVRLLWRAEAADSVSFDEVEMVATGNDVWRAAFLPPAPGRYRYTVLAWVDAWRSWRAELARRVEADDIRIAARVGAELLQACAGRAGKAAAAAPLKDATKRLRGAAGEGGKRAKTLEPEALKALALDSALAELADRHPDLGHAARYSAELPLVADRARARFSSWYELFPRSASPEAGRHGRFADVEARLPYVAQLGFDVLYLPPIHPIGRVKRKGPNNALAAGAGDLGSPWAIGAAEGGHKSVLPELGTLEDFHRLVEAARGHGLEIALDIALQCAPDHPYVKAHPQWFRWRPDGSVQYAENPPKKYQDIYPFNFETEDWRALWQELKSIFDHWIAQGVAIFRVDNPHTKAFSFWEWAISEIKREHPEVIFLAEAFTRPKVMHRLAKLGFSQSYTYYTWRNTRQELVDYFTELTHGPGRDYFRPNVWPNTPDILNEHLHGGGREIFGLRLLLAATLCSSYGVYGPAYELMENRPREPGSEEYLDSEKYQLRHWELARPDSLAPLMARINRIRRDNPALHANHGLAFLATDNPQLLAYSKRSDDGENVVLCVMNLDVHNVQSGWLTLDTLGIEPDGECHVHDQLGDQHFIWQGQRAFILLDPRLAPGHVFRVRRRVKREQDFDYFA